MSAQTVHFAVLPEAKLGDLVYPELPVQVSKKGWHNIGGPMDSILWTDLMRQFGDAGARILPQRGDQPVVQIGGGGDAIAHALSILSA